MCIRDSYKGAAEIDLTCEAQNGSFTITDARSNQSYKGQYRLEERSPEGTIYEIKLGEATGYAVTGITTDVYKRQGLSGYLQMLWPARWLLLLLSKK